MLSRNCHYIHDRRDRVLRWYCMTNNNNKTQNGVILFILYPHATLFWLLVTRSMHETSEQGSRSSSERKAPAMSAVAINFLNSKRNLWVCVRSLETAVLESMFAATLISPSRSVSCLEYFSFIFLKCFFCSSFIAKSAASRSWLSFCERARLVAKWWARLGLRTTNDLSWNQCMFLRWYGHKKLHWTHQLGRSNAETFHAEFCSSNSSACGVLPLGHDHVNCPHPPHFCDGRSGLQSHHDTSTDGDRGSMAIIVDC